MGVNGGYNILLAYNIYRMGANNHLIEVVFPAMATPGVVSPIWPPGLGPQHRRKRGRVDSRPQRVHLQQHCPQPGRLPETVAAPVHCCQDSNPTCNAARLRADNAINTVAPELRDPEGGDYRPVPGDSVYSVATCPIPDFCWDDASARPAVSPGDLDNRTGMGWDRQP